MSPCGRARRHTSRGAMAILAWKFPRTRLPVGASALCVVVLCWLYIFPVYRLPNEKEIVQGVLQQGTAWRRNQTAASVFRKQMEDCCDPAHLFAMTKLNSPMGKSMWYDGEFLYSFTIDNSTYSLFPQATPFQLPLKKCAVVGNGGILKKSGCGRQIDEANFVMRFQNLLWSRKTFVDNMKIYNHSYIYMPAFSMKTGTEPSLRVYYTLSDVGANQTVLFANPNFLRSIGKFWKSRGIHAKRLSTGLFLVSAALGLCEEVAIYGFWPFSVNMHEQPISHHYYDNVLPFSGFHAMPEEFLQLWYLHKIGALRMQLDPCEDTSLQPTS
ncbi:alpha-N-acetylneuraminide alpha-2,8-sialyltransferase isoform X2 [Vulpes lagopus]|uniref:alpha-N-acetylneuraminide alpha-2,8-sialyltransferase isoform X2 n=1 Tax=Vulpes lagopus TaxID=494514 RepID=UPI001BC9A54D|nr:alpha-N-acetylneuraminide alpha-2,8-sialyltransferase isoform X2 [Vulpes lagopus]